MNEKVIFTNGCFDIVHRAHLELLNYCKSLGGKVVVGLNSDNSVRRLKGNSRPFFNETDRKFMLQSLKFVDEVVVFDEDTPLKIIQQLQPDIIVKGGDYTEEQVVGNSISKVVIFKYIDGYSTTKVLQSSIDR